ncbi:hypothetical protein GCM10009665_80300 [Kitasatospora nipponensis]|uniref:Uncharacterized protein n=1 Tax=Kitasatospora nipponensis TaxID=258049 RepID=A0ABN1THX9_9ACTN
MDRDNEGNGVLVDKLAAYRAWCELPARYTAKKAFEESLPAVGARTHDLPRHGGGAALRGPDQEPAPGSRSCWWRSAPSDGLP